MDESVDKMSKTKDSSTELPAANPPRKNVAMLVAAGIAFAAWITYLIYLIVALS